jgi:DNA-binding transcriptional ArsR family regulator
MESAVPTSPQLDLVFGALADHTRREILRRLTSGEASVAELTAGFAISQPAISKHLRVLERAGLISRTRRGTMRLSRLDAAPLRSADVWLAPYRAYWDESFARLDDLLTTDDTPPEAHQP